MFISVLAAACVVCLVIWYFATQNTGDTVTITMDGKVYGTYDLAQDQEIEVSRDGQVVNLVRISDGEVFMAEADCPDHLCIRQGKISADRQTIVCLPNRVVVEISSETEPELDSVAR